MKEALLSKIETIAKEAPQIIRSLKNLEQFQNYKVQLLGKKGVFTEVLKGLKELNPEDRPVIGKLANQVKTEIETKLEEVERDLESKKKEAELKALKVDITAPGLELRQGSRHPISLCLETIETFFLKMGFSIHEGTDIETDYYNFEALNFPPEHPARDMQDTFYLKEEAGSKKQETRKDSRLATHESRATSHEPLLLRTHTSPVQIRVMEKTEPPLNLIAPGIVYRHDDDITHSPMFHQVEGLMVDRHITFADLKGVLSAFCKHIFGEKREVRFQPSYFPFVEPGAEVSISCVLCKQKGCRVCKGSGFIEILGAGMVHPAVFEEVNVDPKRFTGFAFGMGVERIAMLQYGIDDIRLFFEGDVRFLEQF